MSKYKVDITGINTSEIEVLSADEMNELFIRYQGGDLSAKERLVNGNLKLVLSILKNYNHLDKNMDDLFQVGVIGLIKAIDNFDLSFGLKLSTYAVPLIVGEVKRYLRDDTALRVSRSTKDMAYKIIKFKDEYMNEFGIEATPEKICEALEIDEYTISYALDAMKDATSIFEPIYNDGNDTIYLCDQIADQKDASNDKDLIISLRKALNKIDERERKVLIERYIIGKTQTEMANILGISQAQVSRIEKSAMERVRKLIK